MATEPKEVRDIRVPLPLPLHRALKKCAADHDETMQNVVIAALWAWVGFNPRPLTPQEFAKGAELELGNDA